MATSPAEFKVIDVRRLPSPDPKRLGKWDKIVIYELDPMRRYSVLLPEEGMTDDTIVAAVRADIEERRQWLGKTYKL